MDTPPAPGIRSLYRSAQFVWFCGHVLSLTGGISYTLFSLRVFKAPSFPLFWYREAYVAAIFTFGIILNQTYRAKPVTIAALLRDDNVHYMMLAFLWLVSKPFFGTLPPFMIFSLFHVLTYMRSFLLPALGYPASSSISAQLHTFVTTYNARMMSLAATTEALLLVRLALMAVTFRKGNIAPFLIYFLFMKLRYDCSIYTRTAVRTWEVRIDNIVGHPQVPGFFKNGWLQFKEIIRVYVGGLFAVPPSPADATGPPPAPTAAAQ